MMMEANNAIAAEREREEMEQVRLLEYEIKVEDGSGGSGSSDTAGIGQATIDLIKETDGDTEFKLEKLLEEPDSHTFFCLNCKACIENINVVRREELNPIQYAFVSNFLIPPVHRYAMECSTAPAQPVPGVPEKKWDILESIVYGGLLESIASLNIVTSAAGADATALKILALGLANLIGGLFVIGHNLMQLRNDQSGEFSADQINEETSRYHRELGPRENFKLHTIVIVLSFLLFGLVAPVTYSFSFLKSGNKDLKLAAVAAASLVCITVLAIGKAYTQKASRFFRYVKTVLSFVIPGFMASGVSYVVGHLIKKLLEKLGLFESSSAFTLSLPGTATPESGWGFY
ncbi:membrane protein of ER body-like protein [Vitis riparia]|uniref:membrane protein of ER body-like protein n=1 Tax=Vitis riparia TaxID=96939 RepID=UPI00155B01C6|nr:membrane protein of ER body-like protein [Vitis riparia]